MVELDKTLIVIVGPTAVGKTDLSIDLAKTFNCPIISTDSRQFYAEMNIGTAKPSDEELAAVKHYFINSRSVTEEYTAGMYETDALELLSDIFKTHQYCVAVGGSGLYVNALCYGIDDIPSDVDIRKQLVTRLKNEGLAVLQQELKQVDPEFYASTDIQNPRRILRGLEVFTITRLKYSALRKNARKERTFKTIWIGLEMEPEKLYDRINQRVDKMMEAGLLDEVKSMYHFKHHRALQTVGYQEIIDYMDNKTNLEKAVELIKRNSRRFAKKQFTWFRRNQEIKWFNPADKAAVISFIRSK